jgi:hypothetical protein
MPLDEFRKGFSEMYQGELVGEAFFSELTRRFEDPEHRYKLATLLQLETETAARLRPAALELGLDLYYLEEYRRMCEDFLKGCEGMDWGQFMVFFKEAVGPFVQRYAEIAETAPPEYRDLAESMVTHERAIETFAHLERSGDSEGALDDVIQQLDFPLRRGS